jgi:hypothetical protein
MRTVAHPPVQCLQRTALPVLFLWLLMGAANSQAQEAIYRCGQEYTNQPRAMALCERLAPQAITVINGTRPSPVPSPVPSPMPSSLVVPSTAPPALNSPARSAEAPRAAPQQAARDAAARAVLEQELLKAQAQLAQLRQDFNHGEPEKWASESRNHQKYLDRVAALKAAIERSERDIDSLQRELTQRQMPSQLQTSRTPRSP